MKTLLLLASIALFAVGASALPPTAVGDSFIRFSYVQSGGGLFGSGLIYLATDGSCRQLTLAQGFGDPNSGQIPTYDNSRTGTYTYTPHPDDPTQATLVASISGDGTTTGYFFTLQFTGDTAGTLEFAPQGPEGPQFFAQGSFSFLLNSKNTFLTNVSNRVTLRPTDTAITGFVVQGGASRLVLIRTVGPTLTEFGVSPVSQNPQLNLFSGTGTSQIASGQVWGAVTGYDSQAMSWIFSMVGAFALKPGSNDVAYFGLLAPGVYTAQSSDSKTPAATGGTALCEVYIFPYSG